MDTEQTAVAQPKTVPRPWEGGFKLYKYSRAVILRNWQPYLVVLLMTMVVSVIQDRVLSTSPGGSDITGLDTLIGVACAIITLVLGVSLIRIILAGLAGKKITLVDSLRPSAWLLVRYFLSAIVIATILTVSVLLLVVPFFFVMPRLLLVEFFLIDKNMGPIEAVKASWVGTKGNVKKAWGIIGATIAIGLLMFTIIGIPFAIYFLFMYSAAFGVLYGYVQRPKAEEVLP